jgi:GH35 family endo-1,4-beta-xylanase
MHPPGPDVGKDITPATKMFTQTWVSDQLSIENPDARASVANYFKQVVSRYKDSKAIAGWIVGNEYGYLGLWSFRQEGYDPATKKAFREWLAKTYNNDIAALNAVWGSSFASFDAVIMPIDFNRDRADWADLIAFREHSTADFIAMSTQACKEADPNHLVSYSKLGLVFGPQDWQYNAEDDVTIVNACRERGYPLDFFSINNYASSAIGMEMRSGQWGIELVKRTGLPILVTELGCTSTDIEFLDPKSNEGFSDQRQGNLIANQIIGAMLTGAIGVHVFTWENRDYITTREYGFGITNMDRSPKLSYAHVAKAYQMLENIIQFDINIITDLQRDNYDALMYWPNQIDSVHNRFLVEQGSLHGVMERIGFKVKYINETQLRSGQFNNGKLLILPLNERMQAGDMKYINDNMLSNGVNVLSNAVLPGYQDYHVNKLADFETNLATIFGVKAKTINTFDGKVDNYCVCEMKHTVIELNPNVAFQPDIAKDQKLYAVPWKYSTIEAIDAQVLYGMRIIDQTNEFLPAVTLKSHEKAKALLFSYTMGEAYMTIQDHYSMLKGLLVNSDMMGLSTNVQLTGSGAVTPFFYKTNDDRAVLYLMNWDDYKSTTVTVQVDYMKGKSIRDLRNDRALVDPNSADGKLTVTLGQNEVKLYIIGDAVKPSIGIDPINTPASVIPNGVPVVVSVNYDTAGRKSSDITVELRQVGSSRVYATADKTVSGTGATTLSLDIADFSRFDSNYKASSDNVKYFFRAIIKDGKDQSEASFPVMLEFLKPTTDLASSVNATVPITTSVSWNYLPSFKFSAFRGLIVIFKSTKTIAVDPTHAAKVDSIAASLKELGFRYSPGLASWDTMDNFQGPMFYIATDNVPNFDGSSALQLDFLQRRVKTLILPGVTVLSADEIASIKSWVATPNGYKTLITTEGGVGGATDPLADVFGVVAGKNADASAATGLVVTNSSSPVVAYVSSPINMALNGAVPGAGWSTVSTGYALATYGSRPALIVNNYGSGRAFAFNFDITQLSDQENAKKVWRGVEQFAEIDPFIYKFKWELVCGSDIVGSYESWINNTWSNAYVPGGASFSIVPTDSCSKASYNGYLFKYGGDKKQDAVAYYSSDNDSSDISNGRSSSGSVGLVSSIALLIMAVLLQL